MVMDVVLVSVACYLVAAVLAALSALPPVPHSPTLLGLAVAFLAVGHLGSR